MPAITAVVMIVPAGSRAPGDRRRRNEEAGSTSARA
jgi:hypothetical protein